MAKEERANVDAEIGKLIAAARQRQKVSRGKAAEMLGISYPMLQKHERGITPITVNRLLQLAEAINVPFTDFLPPSRAKGKNALVLSGSEERSLIQAFRDLPTSAVRTKAVELFLEVTKSGKTRRG
jgi:transcriptional regulator with XRE-family HTH domain